VNAQPAHAGGRPDLAGRPPATRDLPHHGSANVQVAGGTRQDRTALVAALLHARSGRITLTDDDPVGTLGAAMDAVLLVASAAQVLGPAELDQAHALRHRSPRILLALTAVDRHPDWREVLEADLERLRAVGVAVTSFAVSLDMHRRAAATHDPALGAASGIPALARRLDDIAAQNVPSAPGHCETTSTVPSPAPRPAARRPRTAPDRNRWQQVLADGMAAASSDVDFDLRSRVRTVVADAERVVEASDPARNWDDFHTWLRERLAYEGEQTFALLADRTAEVAAALGRELGGKPLRRPARTGMPAPFDNEPLRDAPTGSRRPLATRSRSLVMSAYGGLMMALILPRFAGVQLPVWVVVAGALSAAVLLGGATLSGERRRQLETRRKKAMSLIRHTADDFLLIATKHTRDTVRRSQTELRNECATRTQRVMDP
jgi:hypothetical protein